MEIITNVHAYLMFGLLVIFADALLRVAGERKNANYILLPRVS